MSGSAGACDHFVDSVAELALGTLVGEERAVALAHVERCPSCRATLEGLALTADALLQIAPTAEPPVGFESRLFAAIGEDRRPVAVRIPRRRGYARGLGIAAAVALTFGFGIGLGRMSNPSVTPGRLAVGHLTSGGLPRGEVVLAAGKPAWMVMAVEDAGTARSVECRVTLASGKKVTVGWFTLAKGYGEWSAPLTVDPSQVRTAELIGPDGSTVAAATLSH